MENKFKLALQDIDNCSSMEEIEKMREYVKNTFWGYKSNSYFWHCRDRFNKRIGIING